MVVGCVEKFELSMNGPVTLVNSYNIAQYLSLCYLLSSSIFSDDLGSESKKKEASTVPSS